MAYKIDELQLKNFGMLEEFRCDQFSNINLTNVARIPSSL